ncbi:hypothetical protein TNCV_3047671 [Trichonephila clavipes]|nr:hypothetical protein TNCV_3047671 [Trichonephila clavipes]
MDHDRATQISGMPQVQYRCSVTFFIATGSSSGCIFQRKYPSRMMRNRPNIFYYGCHAHNSPVIMVSDATRWVRLDPLMRRFPPSPAMTDPHHSCLVSPNMLTDFSVG